MSGAKVREWLRWHSVQAHILGPIWKRIPEKRRWDIVHLLNRSDRFCWSDLVDSALRVNQDDACDIPVPRPEFANLHCRTVCGWMGGEHRGEHDCGCYCGKFQFVADEGSIDRQATS